MRIGNQLRHLIKMILEIIMDMISFMVVISVSIFVLTLLMYQSRALAQGDITFPEALLQMYALAIGTWDYSNYSGFTNIFFFVIATILQPLLLLNMLIALMNDSYSRVQGERTAYDAREKVIMMYEITSASVQFIKLKGKLNDWIIRYCCCCQRRKSGAAEPEGEEFFLLVATKFQLKDESDMTLNEIAEKNSGQIKQLENLIKGDIQMINEQNRLTLRI